MIRKNLLIAIIFHYWWSILKSSHFFLHKTKKKRKKYALLNNRLFYKSVTIYLSYFLRISGYHILILILLQLLDNYHLHHHHFQLRILRNKIFMQDWSIFDEQWIAEYNYYISTIIAVIFTQSTTSFIYEWFKTTFSTI